MRKLEYVIRRILTCIPLLLVLSFVLFVLLRLTPGDPVGAILGLQATPETMAALRHELGLDQPVWKQYVDWLWGVLHGDFGVEYRARKPIGPLLAQRIPVTLELTFLAMLTSICISIPLGILAALYRGTTIDRVAMTASILGITLPDFWIGVMLIFLVALRLNLLPASGFVPFTEDPLQNLIHLILPAISLAWANAAVQIRMTRGAMLEVLSKEYVDFARAKGLVERTVILKHVFRNGAITVVTVVGMQSGYLFGGSLVIETLFGIPGLGKLTVDSIFQRNYPLVLSSILLLAFMFMMMNLLTDITYSTINPLIEEMPE